MTFIEWTIILTVIALLTAAAWACDMHDRHLQADRDHEVWANTIGLGPTPVECSRPLQRAGRRPLLTEEDIVAKKGVPQTPAKAPEPPCICGTVYEISGPCHATHHSRPSGRHQP